jgi:hypothetical protein
MSKPYKVTKQPHSFTQFSKKTGLSGYKWCWNCGLLQLNNEASRKAYNKACTVKEDCVE